MTVTVTVTVTVQKNDSYNDRWPLLFSETGPRLLFQSLY
jgi:hypothetical protein